ncbi:MAG: hypothetical protein AAF799_10025 [Myxococcota bacterium]
MADRPDIRPLMDRQRRRGATLLLLWLGLMLGLSFPYFEATRNANERPRLLQAMALVEEGSFAIDGPGARGLDPGPDVSRSRADDRIYPNKPPGTTLIAAAAYRGARAMSDDLDLRTYTWWARILAGWLPTMILAGLLFRRYAAGFGPRVAAGAVTLYALGTPAASYAHLLYGHQLAAMFLFAGIALLVDAGRDVGRRRALVSAALGGGLAGAAVGVEYGAVFAALPIAGLLLARVRKPDGAVVLIAGLAGALVPILALAAYHQHVYGSPWSTGYHHVTNADFAAKHGQGLLGLGLPGLEGATTHLLSADGGLLWWAPTVVLALYGLAQLAHKPGPLCAEARVHLAVLVVYGLVVSSLSFEGGWRVGPRYLVVALPSLCMGWAHVLSQARTKISAMVVVAALGTYAVVVNALAANLWPHFDLTNIHQPVTEVLLPLWEHDRHPYGFVQLLTGRSGLRLVVVGSVIGTWTVFGAMAEGGYRMALGIIGGSLVGLLLVGSTYVIEPHPKGERNLAYIERIWEPRGETPGKSVSLTGPLHSRRGGRSTGESSRSSLRPKRSRRRGSTRRE